MDCDSESCPSRRLLFVYRAIVRKTRGNRQILREGHIITSTGFNVINNALPMTEKNCL